MKTRAAQKVVAVALIRNREGRILMQKRMAGKFPAATNKWEFPGGQVEFGEAPEATAVREALEETDCVIRLTRLLTTHSRVWKRRDGLRVHAVVVCYEAEHVSGKPRPEKGKSTKVRWCTDEEVAGLDHLEGVPKFLAASKKSCRVK